MPSKGASASAHRLRGAMPRRARSVRADRSFCCSLGTFSALRMPRAPETILAPGVRFFCARSAMEHDLLDESGDPFLVREPLTNFLAENHKLVPRRIAQRSEV